MKPNKLATSEAPEKQPNVNAKRSRRRISLGLKLAYTAFVAVLVPIYWINYGPTNFLYFCDMALFVTLAAVWRESSLLASMAAVGIVLPQMLWVADFLAALAGFKLTGMTAYMFNAALPLHLRGLSLFHGWLPFLLLFLVARLGYDRRAILSWTVLAWVLVLVCYLCLPAPGAVLANPNAPVNINYVHGMSDTAAQTWMPPLAWLATLLVGLPVLLYLPAHGILSRVFKQAAPVAKRRQPDRIALSRA